MRQREMCYMKSILRKYKAPIKFRLDQLFESYPSLENIIGSISAGRYNKNWTRLYLEQKIFQFNQARCKVIDSSNFKSLIYSNNKLTPHPKENVLASYLPFINEKSGIMVNNFFAHNYGIRTPLLIQYSVIVKNEILLSRQIVIPANGSFIDENICIGKGKLIEGVLIVQCFNPRIRNGHGGHGGYLRCHGIYEKDKDTSAYSFVHSMPFAPESFNFFDVGEEKTVIAPRAFLPKFIQSDVDIQSYSMDESPSDLILKNLSYFQRPGTGTTYNVTKSQSGGLRGIWHDGPDMSVQRIASPSPNLVTGAQAVYIPDFQNNAPFLFFSIQNIQYESKSIQVELRDDSGKVYRNPVETDTYPFIVDCKQLFPEYRGLGTKLFIYFEDCIEEFNAVLMVHVMYRDRKNLIGDCTHTANGQSRKNNRLLPKSATAMCIWGPFIKSNSLRFQYTLHNICKGLEDAGDLLIKIRVTTDLQYEAIFYEHILTDRDIYTIDCNYIDQKTQFKKNCKRSAYVQFECRDGSLQGNFFQISDKGDVGVDHLTGG